MASEIRVNKINSQTGVGTITLSPTGVDISGITTASTLRATTGIITTLQVGTISGDGSSLTGVAATDNVRTGILDVAGVGTFRNDVNIPDKIIHLGDTDTAIRFPAADTITAETGGSERLRIDSNGLIANNARVPSSYGSPNLLVSGTDSTLTLMGDGSSNNSSFTGIKFRVAGASSGDYTKAGIFAQRQGGYNDLDLIFSLDTAADANSVAISDEKLRITSGGKLLGGNYFTSKQIGAITAPVQIQGTSADTSALSLFRYSADTGGSTITLGKGRGTSGGAVDKPQENDTVGTIHFHVANNNDLVNGNVAAIDVQVDDPPGGGDTPGRIRFLTSPDGSSTLSEAMRITKDGRLLIGTTSYPDGSADGIALRASNGERAFSRGNTSTRYQLVFYNPNGNIGRIETSGSSTSYLTSSDYRLKENATAISDGITRLKTLKPYRFNFKADATKTLDGFFAHEVTAVPEAVSGTKDEVDENGKIITQQLDQSKLVPLLTAALQEAVTKIEVLETRLNNAGIAT